MTCIAPRLFSSIVRVSVVPRGSSLGLQSASSLAAARGHLRGARQFPLVGRASPARSERFLLPSSCLVLLCPRGTSSDRDFLRLATSARLPLLHVPSRWPMSLGQHRRTEKRPQLRLE